MHVLIVLETEGREICALSQQVVCVSESFTLTLEKEEIFGSWKLHLTLPSVQYKVENKREDDLEAGKRPH